MAPPEGEESLERFLLTLLDNGVPVLDPQALDALLLTFSVPQSIPGQSQAKAIKLYVNLVQGGPHLVVKRYTRGHLYKMT
ncbi:hypothetical protein Pmani_032008 [Petrolisthes manimaculis]|uniref:Uncharacterized protein n=1 Tax=Petrolisthes manimaculis TaxID=1843537 RepID=A0AAE1NSL2_9EUCA|nr:hypothetical protein Pmani_032008 [Petrolisthes manimaculis]